MGRVLLILLGVAGIAGGVMWAKFPRPSSDRVEALPGVVGIAAGGGSMAWIVRTPNGAALVDAGMDLRAGALLAELGRMGLAAADVHTILVTHAHFDHWGGTAAFPGARVVVGKGDAALVRGEAQSQRLLVSFFTRFAPKAPVPARLEELLGDGELDVDGLAIRAIHVPGHTPGSVMFLLGPLLFTGDSAVGTGGGRGLGPPPGMLSEDPAQNLRSLQALADVPFTLAADGHTGVIADARARLQRSLH